MHPELFKIGSITIYTYGFLMAIGILSAILITVKRGENRGFSKDNIYDIAFYGVIGGIIGAKLLYIIAEAPTILRNPKSIIYMLTSGFVVYGALIGGALAAYIYCKVKGLSFIKHFDLAAPSIAFAQGIGRIGCLEAGCCYGRETNSIFGIVFHSSPFAPNGVKLIPTQIISSIGNFTFFLILIWFARKERKNGQVAGLYMLLYSIGRFIIEFYRGDFRGNVGFLSTSQFISVIIFIIAIIFLNLDKIAPASQGK